MDETFDKVTGLEKYDVAVMVIYGNHLNKQVLMRAAELIFTMNIFVYL